MEERLPLAKTIWRLLTFRTTEDELKRLDWRFLVVGLIGTWLVGIGRYWDAPDPKPAQLLGVGSLVYVVLLAAFLFLVAHPLRPANWSYRNVLTFITLTSFPAGLYALPVERWVSIDAAIQINVWFLAIVAFYRVALYLFYMSRLAGLGLLAVLTAVFLPITLIIGFVTMSGYAGAIMNIMGGLRERTVTPQDGVNEALAAVTFGSCLSLPVWLIIYGVLIAARSNMRGREPGP